MDLGSLSLIELIEDINESTDPWARAMFISSHSSIMASGPYQSGEQKKSFIPSPYATKT
jgi:hypothetical protein